MAEQKLIERDGKTYQVINGREVRVVTPEEVTAVQREAVELGETENPDGSVTRVTENEDGTYRIETMDEQGNVNVTESVTLEETLSRQGKENVRLVTDEDTVTSVSQEPLDERVRKEQEARRYAETQQAQTEAAAIERRRELDAAARKKADLLRQEQALREDLEAAGFIPEYEEVPELDPLTGEERSPLTLEQQAERSEAVTTNQRIALLEGLQRQEGVYDPSDGSYDLVAALEYENEQRLRFAGFDPDLVAQAVIEKGRRRDRSSGITPAGVVEGSPVLSALEPYRTGDGYNVTLALANGAITEEDARDLFPTTGPYRPGASDDPNIEEAIRQSRVLKEAASDGYYADPSLIPVEVSESLLSMSAQFSAQASRLSGSTRDEATRRALIANVEAIDNFLQKGGIIPDAEVLTFAERIATHRENIEELREEQRTETDQGRLQQIAGQLMATRELLRQDTLDFEGALRRAEGGDVYLSSTEAGTVTTPPGLNAARFAAAHPDEAARKAVGEAALLVASGAVVGAGVKVLRAGVSAARRGLRLGETITRAGLTPEELKIVQNEAKSLQELARLESREGKLSAKVLDRDSFNITPAQVDEFRLKSDLDRLLKAQRDLRGRFDADQAAADIADLNRRFPSELQAVGVDDITRLRTSLAAGLDDQMTREIGRIQGPLRLSEERVLSEQRITAIVEALSPDERALFSALSAEQLEALVVDLRTAQQVREQVNPVLARMEQEEQAYFNFRMEQALTSFRLRNAGRSPNDVELRDIVDRVVEGLDLDAVIGSRASVEEPLRMKVPVLNEETHTQRERVEDAEDRRSAQRNMLEEELLRTSSLEDRERRRTVITLLEKTEVNELRGADLASYRALLGERIVENQREQAGLAGVMEDLRRDVEVPQRETIADQVAFDLVPRTPDGGMAEGDSIGEQIRRDLEGGGDPAFEGDPSRSDSIDEQIRRDLEGEGDPSRNDSIDEQIRRDLEGRTDKDEEGSPDTRLTRDPFGGRVEDLPGSEPSLIDPVARKDDQPFLDEQIYNDIRVGGQPSIGEQIEEDLGLREGEEEGFRFREELPLRPRQPQQPRPPRGKVPKLRLPKLPKRKQELAERMYLTGNADWIGHKQGAWYRYTQLSTGREVQSLEPIWGKVPDLKGPGSAKRSARVITRTRKATKARVDRMGAMNVHYPKSGTPLRFKRSRKAR